ncbi:hypothetical protein F5887DRAFT_926125 [Amanita rubescens]|nr:hypothetical protein F5887DRAFT_926125 [Amanita rubescens]
MTHLRQDRQGASKGASAIILGDLGITRHGKRGLGLNSMSSPALSANDAIQENGDRARPLIERLSTPPPEYPLFREGDDAPIQSLQEPAYPYGSMYPSFNRRRGDCTGDEIRHRGWMEEPEQSAEDRRRNGFALDLINRVEYFGLEQGNQSTIHLGRGQLVHRVIHRPHIAGRGLEIDHGGPYIIIDRCHTHYLLMTRKGDIFPQLVPAPSRQYRQVSIVILGYPQVHFSELNIDREIDFPFPLFPQSRNLKLGSTAVETAPESPEVPSAAQIPSTSAILSSPSVERPLSASLFDEVIEAENRSYFEEPTRQFPGALPFDSPFRPPFDPDSRRVSTPAHSALLAEFEISDQISHQSVPDLHQITEEDRLEEEEGIIQRFEKIRIRFGDPDTTVQQISMEVLPIVGKGKERAIEERLEPRAPPPRPQRSASRPNSPRVQMERSVSEEEDEIQARFRRREAEMEERLRQREEEAEERFMRREMEERLRRRAEREREEESERKESEYQRYREPEVQPNVVYQQPARLAAMPAKNSSSAPNFDSQNPRTLIRYFRELEHLMDAANIDERQSRKEHAMRYLDNEDYETWESLPEARIDYTYAAFKQAVIDSYPGAEETRKYRLDDVAELTDKWRKEGITTPLLLGNYFREYRNATNYLIEHRRLSEMEQRRRPSSSTTSYAAPATRSAPVTSTASATVKQEDLLSAIGRLVNTLNTNVTTYPPTNRYVPPAGPVPPTTTSAPAAPIAPAYPATSVPYTAAAFPRRSGPSETERCNFCGESGHFMANCPVAEHYLRSGRIVRKADGKLVLPNGMFVPRSIEGAWLKDRVDTYWQRQLGDQANVNPAPTEVSTPDAAPAANAGAMFFSVASGSKTTEGTRAAFASVVSEEEEEALAEDIEYYQQQIFALQAKQKAKKLVFDGVEIMKKPTESGHGETERGVASPEKDKGKEKATTPVPETSQPAVTAVPATQPSTTEVPSASTSSTEPPTHPFEKAKDANYLPPVNRNLGAIGKTKDPAYHTQAPIQDAKFVDTVLERSLKETHVTLTFEELLSLSPDLRYRIRDKVTPKRQAPATKHVSFAGDGDGEIEELVSPSALADLELDATRIAPDRYRVPDIAQVLYSAQNRVDGEKRIVLQSKKESLASRAITMKVAEKSNVECILDPGSEIICMSDAVSHQLGIPYDPTVTIRMQSANGERDPTLGLARDVPFEIGNFVLLFQVHVVRSPAYDILLGRPFDDLTNAKVENMPNEEQVCTINHPESGRAFAIPTVARGPARFTKMREEKDFHLASRN